MSSTSTIWKSQRDVPGIGVPESSSAGSYSNVCTSAIVFRSSYEDPASFTDRQAAKGDAAAGAGLSAIGATRAIRRTEIRDGRTRLASAAVRAGVAPGRPPRRRRYRASGGRTSAPVATAVPTGSSPIAVRKSLSASARA